MLIAAACSVLPWARKSSSHALIAASGARQGRAREGNRRPPWCGRSTAREAGGGRDRGRGPCPRGAAAAAPGPAAASAVARCGPQVAVRDGAAGRRRRRPSRGARQGRRSPGGRPSDLTFEAIALPRFIEGRCHRLIRNLGLAFGTIDLILAPTKRHVFLEVNPSGQFLFLDAEAGVPLLDALSQMLLQGRKDYEWESASPSVRFDSEFEKAVEARQAKAMAEHYSDLTRGAERPTSGV
jgi:hypothetical protein